MKYISIWKLLIFIISLWSENKGILINKKSKVMMTISEFENNVLNANDTPEVFKVIMNKYTPKDFNRYVIGVDVIDMNRIKFDEIENLIFDYCKDKELELEKYFISEYYFMSNLNLEFENVIYYLRNKKFDFQAGAVKEFLIEFILNNICLYYDEKEKCAV